MVVPGLMEFTIREVNSVQTRLSAMGLTPRIVPTTLRDKPVTIICLSDSFLSHSQIEYLLDLCTRFHMELFYCAPNEGKAYHGLTKLDERADSA